MDDNIGAKRRKGDNQGGVKVKNKEKRWHSYQGIETKNQG
jgi:hypothetical protein